MILFAVVCQQHVYVDNLQNVLEGEDFLETESREQIIWSFSICLKNFKRCFHTTFTKGHNFLFISKLQKYSFSRILASSTSIYWLCINFESLLSVWLYFIFLNLYFLTNLHFSGGSLLSEFSSLFVYSFFLKLLRAFIYYIY